MDQHPFQEAVEILLSSFMLLKPEISASLMGHLARMQTYDFLAFVFSFYPFQIHYLKSLGYKLGTGQFISDRFT